MKKIRFSAIMLLIGIIIINGCKKMPSPSVPGATNTPAITNTTAIAVSSTMTKTSTQTKTITISNTQQNTPVLTATPTLTCACLTGTDTPAFTLTLTPPPSATSTHIATPTTTATFSCVDAQIHIIYNYIRYISGTNVNVMVYTNPSTFSIKIVIYDGTGNSISSSTFPSGGNLTAYIIQGNENISASWHVAVMQSSQTPPLVFNASDPAILDSESFNVVPVVPTQTATPPCADMPILAADSGFAMEKYNFKLQSCETVYFENRWASQAANISYYDGSGTLLYVQQVPWAMMETSSYAIKGTEAPGQWRIILFTTSTTPPANDSVIGYGYQGVINTCPSIYFSVQ